MQTVLALVFVATIWVALTYTFRVSKRAGFVWVIFLVIWAGIAVYLINEKKLTLAFDNSAPLESTE
jgi:uncharacterized membrane protein YwaF